MYQAVHVHKVSKTTDLSGVSETTDLNGVSETTDLSGDEGEQAN